MKKLLIILLLTFSMTGNAECIFVELEPFPPVINDDGSGILPDMLAAIEAKTDLSFQVTIATYARAKKDLHDGKVKLIGLTPKGNESKSFYRGAIELDWFFQATVDIYAQSPRYLNEENLTTNSIGTLTGNADFMSMVTNIPREKFIEVSSLEQLARLIVKKRIKAAIFERASMMSTISRLKLANIHYNKLITIPAGLAVKKTRAGQTLKKQLDKALLTLNTRAYLTPLNNFNQLANAGIVTTISDKKKR
ncbi:hypothetical protein Q4489_13825 [Thalassotalea sp. 1_MG-2023]|uniref:hypothetical protein n=1 Tax=Thalassotalea sp. 1_MG-2023 TaxID=3062680 RepID=UPI0026E1AEB0|nr:hypothetical protein [Thalassotalea sp. 1_MG-2023]MDO6428094.1 hypothetical protein [Thalassotalea sp. 1_MG-2023]